MGRKRLARLALLLVLVGGAAYLSLHGNLGQLGRRPPAPPDPTAVTVECVNDSGQSVRLDYYWSAAGGVTGHGFRPDVPETPGVRQPVGSITGAAVVTLVKVRRGDAVTETKLQAPVAPGQVFVITVAADGTARGEVAAG
jgi:hypothetical protein